jgi:hypothetical protein
MRNNTEVFKRHENPAYLNIHIQDIKITLKITYAYVEGLKFNIEFNFNNKFYMKSFDNIFSKEKTYNSDEIEFEGIELHTIEKERIALCLNEILDYIFPS